MPQTLRAGSRLGPVESGGNLAVFGLRVAPDGEASACRCTRVPCALCVVRGLR